ncbi:hypothetical protein [Methylobacterium sp. WL7]|uniref:hypothetical protein n=1 Tax=Methylobacterium sp. WL7 TaxID=2603900 RepID=UPI00164FCFD6|nr:hypothetical protein [Methylobacterium sp. WL7]
MALDSGPVNAGIQDRAAPASSEYPRRFGQVLVIRELKLKQGSEEIRISIKPID